ncbi:MAG TPA: hypothetical protein VLF60_04915 [Candidatus Saccharimonadales bacterium]|nr:hypothetical protein [Candidatus Saccharimonadales bacterium]
MAADVFFSGGAESGSERVAENEELLRRIGDDKDATDDPDALQEELAEGQGYLPVSSVLEGVMVGKMKEDEGDDEAPETQQPEEGTPEGADGEAVQEYLAAQKNLTYLVGEAAAAATRAEAGNTIAVPEEITLLEDDQVPPNAIPGVVIREEEAAPETPAPVEDRVPKEPSTLEEDLAAARVLINKIGTPLVDEAVEKPAADAPEAAPDEAPAASQTASPQPSQPKPDEKAIPEEPIITTSSEGQPDAKEKPPVEKSDAPEPAPVDATASEEHAQESPEIAAAKAAGQEAAKGLLKHFGIKVTDTTAANVFGSSPGLNEALPFTEMPSLKELAGENIARVWDFFKAGAAEIREGVVDAAGGVKEGIASAYEAVVTTVNDRTYERLQVATVGKLSVDLVKAYTAEQGSDRYYVVTGDSSTLKRTIVGGKVVPSENGQGGTGPDRSLYVPNPSIGVRALDLAERVVKRDLYIEHGGHLGLLALYQAFRDLQRAGSVAHRREIQTRFNIDVGRPWNQGIFPRNYAPLDERPRTS